MTVAKENYLLKGIYRSDYSAQENLIDFFKTSNTYEIGAIYQLSKPIQPNGMTWGGCFSIEDIRRTNIFFGTNHQSFGVGLWVNNQHNGLNFRYYAYESDLGIDINKNIFFAISISYDWKSCVYVNGKLKLNNIDVSLASSYIGKSVIDIGDRGESNGQNVLLNSMWVYDKSLNQNEVEYNFQLDLTRFGLKKREL